MTERPKLRTEFSGRLTSLRVRRMSPQDLTRDDIQRWRMLCERSLEPNPFLLPEFVLPLIQRFRIPDPVVLLVVDDSLTGTWRGAGVFEIRRSLPHRPLRYAQGLSSHYSYLDGILLDPEEPLTTLATLFDDQTQHRDWHGFHFDAIRDGSPLANLLDESAAICRVDSCRSQTWERAQYHCDGPTTAEEIVARCSKSRRKSLMRGRRRLEGRGRVEYRLTVPSSDSADCVEGFLRLERMGWKGDRGTAFACRPESERFFRQLAAECGRRDAMIFGEIRLDGELIASTCNLRASHVMSAFKIGWNPAFADCGIGFWSEIELAAAVSRQYPEIRRIDSSSKVGSYVEAIWQGRQPMRSLTYSWSLRGRLVQSARHCYRWVNRMFQDD